MMRLGTLGTRYRGVRCGPHVLELEVEIEKDEDGMMAETLAPHTKDWVS